MIASAPMFTATAVPERPLQRPLMQVSIGLVLLLAVGLLFTLYYGDGGSVTLAHFWTWTQRNYSDLRWFTNAGLYPFYILFVALFLWGWVRRIPEFKLLAQAYLLAQLLGSVLIVRVLKLTTGRARPDATELPGFESQWTGFSWEAAYHSFPSGHTADIVVSAVFAALLVRHPLGIMLCLGWALALALSRLALAKHYPSDALAGALIALLASIVVVRYWLQPRLMRLPSAARTRG